MTDPDVIEPAEALAAPEEEAVAAAEAVGSPSRKGLVLAIVVTALTSVLVLVLLFTAWRVTRLYGTSPTPWLAVLVWALLPALAIAGAAHLGVKALGGRPPHFGVLTVVALVAVVAAQVTTITYAARAYEADVARAAKACAPEVVNELQRLSVFSSEVGTPVGGRDGVCSIVLSPDKDRVSALGEIQQSLEVAGWTLSGRDAEKLTFTRGGVTLTVTPGDPGKGYTDVVIAIQPA